MEDSQKNLWSKGVDCLHKKKYKEAELFLLKALDVEKDNPIYRHLVYNSLIKIYYKLRDESEDALEKCIFFCKEDIKRLEEFLVVDRKESGSEYFPPSCPSVEQLSIIYEKKGEIQKAIDLYQFAIEIGLNKRHEWYNKQYGKNQGYVPRLKRLQKKLYTLKLTENKL